MNEIYLDIRGWNDWFKKRFEGKDCISLEELLGDYENLIFEKDRLEEIIEDIERDKKDNYKPISPFEMNGVSEGDFL